jgi:hypothetical protein
VTRPEPTPPHGVAREGRTRLGTSSTFSQLQPSKWLFQSSPPDLAEARERWTFGLYEILDQREGPFNPRVLHTVYRGVIELDASELPQASDPLFAPKLEEAIVQKYKSYLRS